MTMYQRSPRHDEVDVAPPVHVGQVGAGSFADKKRCRADGFEGTDGAVDATRQDLERARKRFGRTRRRGRGRHWRFGDWRSGDWLVIAIGRLEISLEIGW